MFVGVITFTSPVRLLARCRKLIPEIRETFRAATLKLTKITVVPRRVFWHSSSSCPAIPVPGLLEDITQMAHSGLEFESSYAGNGYPILNCSISIVQGNYHDLGTFVSTPACRVLLRPRFYHRAAEGNPDLLKMSILARLIVITTQEASNDHAQACMALALLPALLSSGRYDKGYADLRYSWPRPGAKPVGGILPLPRAAFMRHHSMRCASLQQSLSSQRHSYRDTSAKGSAGG
jgi:hypothetical protein